MSHIRLLATALFGGAALVGAQVVTARLLPPIGSVFYLITVAFLEAFEGHGFPTLKGSPDGWPIPTELGKMKVNEFPPGWDKERVRRVIEHYETQSEEEAVAEDEAAYEDSPQTFMQIPNTLVPKVRELLPRQVNR